MFQWLQAEDVDKMVELLPVLTVYMILTLLGQLKLAMRDWLHIVNWKAICILKENVKSLISREPVWCHV